MKWLIFVSIILISFKSAIAQNSLRDSLLNLISTEKLTLTEKMGAYHLITESYAAFDMKNTYLYGMKGLELAKKSGNKRMISVFYRYVGSTYTYRTSYDTAFLYQRMQIEIAEELKDRDFLQHAYFGIANLYARQGKFTHAVENYLKSMTFYNEKSSKITFQPTGKLDLTKTYLHYDPFRTYILCLGNTGECFRRLNNFERALFYLETAKNKLLTADRPGIDLGCYSQIYRELGYVYFAKGDIDKALDYQLKVLNSPSGLNQVHESDCKEALIKIYIIKGQYEKALEYAHDCLRLAESLGDPYIDVLAWNSFAEIYRAQERYEECNMAAMKAWGIDSTSIDTAPISAINIAYANLFLGNKKKAEYFFKKNEEFNKEKSNKNFQEAMADMEVRYETEKKEIRISSLENERQLYLWLIITVALLAMTVGIVLRQKIKNTQKQQQLIATQSVLDGEMGERSRLARDLHDRLSGSLSAVKIGLNNNKESLQNVYEKLDSCIEEIRRVAHNLMPTSLQFGMKVALEDFAAQFPNVHFHFFGEEKRIEDRKEFIVYCCANELVNNSLKYSRAENIDLQLIQGERYVSLTVQDDGCGFDEKVITKGMGLKNIRDRVASCNGKIDIITSPGKGTEIIIEIRV